MSVSTEPADAQKGRRMITYIVVGTVILGLLVVGLLVFHSARRTQVAEAKADQFIAALNKAGLPAPSKDQVVGVLGADGGAVCDDPSSSLKKAILYGELTNGAAGPGIRPVIADHRVVKGELLIIGIYCPDKLPNFTKVVDGLKLENTVNG
jgi:hypothetical protein